jgi:exodeoxyribonuclease-5
MTYTEDQKEALKNMEAWSKKEHKTTLDLLYTLDGAAGTGKTTIMKAFLDKLGVPKSKIAVTAPTHKAKKEISKATGFYGQTIQKLLGLRPDTEMDKFDINNPVFRVLAKDTIKDYKYIIIDESSMLNKDSFKLICEKAKEHKVRIVFLGDAYQLPPINEEISKVFNTVTNISTLTTIVRQGEDNPMATILHLLREDIKNNTCLAIPAMLEAKSIMIGDKGFKCLSQKKHDGYGETSFGEEMLPMFMGSEYNINKNFIKLICYTNPTAMAWSEGLRKRLLGEDAEKIINEGELLVGHSSITNRKTNTVTIANSEDYVVRKVIYGESDDDIKGYFVTLANEDNFVKTVFIVNHLDKENLTRFRTLCIKHLNTAKARRSYYWGKFYKFKHAHLLLVNVAIDPRYEAVKKNLLCSKDLYYGYAITTHKSQGSTYDNTAVNLVDLNSNYKESERARLIYVALSRCRNMNLILVQ